MFEEDAKSWVSLHFLTEGQSPSVKYLSDKVMVALTSFPLGPGKPMTPG